MNVPDLSTYRPKIDCLLYQFIALYATLEQHTREQRLNMGLRAVEDQIYAFASNTSVFSTGFSSSIRWKKKRYRTSSDQNRFKSLDTRIDSNIRNANPGWFPSNVSNLPRTRNRGAEGIVTCSLLSKSKPGRNVSIGYVGVKTVHSLTIKTAHDNTRLLSIVIIGLAFPPISIIQRGSIQPNVVASITILEKANPEVGKVWLRSLINRNRTYIFSSLLLPSDLSGWFCNEITNKMGLLCQL